MQPIYYSYSPDQKPMWKPRESWIDISKNSTNTVSELYRDGGIQKISYKGITLDDTTYNIKIEGGVDGTTLLKEETLSSGQIFVWDIPVGSGKLCTDEGESYTTYRVTVTGNLKSLDHTPMGTGYETEIGLLWSIWKIPTITSDTNNFQPKESISGAANAVYFSILECVDMPYLQTITGIFCNYSIRLQQINLPSLTAVPASIFLNCYSLKSVELPEAISIGAGAFSNCYSLEVVTLPKVTSVLATSNFSNSSKLRIVKLDSYTGTIPATLLASTKLVLDYIYIPLITTINFGTLPVTAKTIILSGVTSITGQMNGFKNIELLDLSGITSYTVTSSSTKLITNCTIHTLKLDSLETVDITGLFSFIDNCNIKVFSAPKLKTITSAITITTPPVTNVLNTSAGAFNGTVFDIVDFSSLETIGTATFVKTIFNRTPSFPKLITCGTCVFNACVGLNNVVFPMLNTVGDYFGCDLWDVLVVRLPSLVVAGNYFMQRPYSLVSINIENVEVVGNNFIYDNAYMKSIKLSKLKEHGSNLLKFLIGLANLDFLGCNVELPVDGTTFLLQNPSIGKLDLRGFNFSKLKISGSGSEADVKTYRLKLIENIDGFDTPLLLPTKAGQWEGTAPHVQINYTTMTAAQLNALFEYMPADQVAGKTWDVKNNIGSSTCDPTILLNKGALSVLI